MTDTGPAVVGAFLLWPLAAIELTPRALAHLTTALTAKDRP